MKMVDHVITIIHLDSPNCSFNIIPQKIVLQPEQVIRFESYGSKIQVDLTNSGYQFSENIFDIENGSSHLVEVVNSSTKDLVFFIGCYTHNPGNPMESRKQVIIKCAGETIDDPISGRLKNLIRDVEVLEQKIRNNIPH